MSRRGSTPFWLLPENLFVLFALPFGIVFAILLPPLGGADEYFHYQRIASVAYGYWRLEDAQVPSGIVLFLQKTIEFLMADKLLPYPAPHFFEVAGIPLGADTLSILSPNYCTIHTAANYIPQVIAFRIGAFFDASPLMLLYITRLAALMGSIWITFHAIRIIPSWKYGLCALALLPPLSLYRICLSTDAMTDAFGILFLACVLREVVRTEPIRRFVLIRIVLLGFLLGLCKFPYAAATLLVLAIPSRRFFSHKAKLLWSGITMLPGALAGLWWMDMSRKSEMFKGLRYETWGGAAYPDGQVAYILSDPLGFAGVLANTLSSLSFYSDTFMEMFGHYGTASQAAGIYYFIMIALLCITLWMDGTSVKASYPIKVKFLALPIIAGFMLVSLTALYVHWTGLQAPTVKGFQGRYLYPFLPLLLMLVPYRGKPHAAVTSALAVSMFGIIGLTLTIGVLMSHWE